MTRMPISSTDPPSAHDQPTTWTIHLENTILFLRYCKYRYQFDYPSPLYPISTIWSLIAQDIYFETKLMLSIADLMNFIVYVESVYYQGLSALAAGVPVHPNWNRYCLFITGQNNGEPTQMPAAASPSVHDSSQCFTTPSTAPNILGNPVQATWTIDQKRFLWKVRHDTYRDEFEVSGGCGTNALWSRIALEFNATFTTKATKHELMDLLLDLLSMKSVEYMSGDGTTESVMFSDTRAANFINIPSEECHRFDRKDYEVAEIIGDIKMEPSHFKSLSSVGDQILNSTLHPSVPLKESQKNQLEKDKGVKSAMKRSFENSPKKVSFMLVSPSSNTPNSSEPVKKRKITLKFNNV